MKKDMNDFLKFLIDNKIQVLTGKSDSGEYYFNLNDVWYYKDDIFEWEGVCEWSDCVGNALLGVMQQLSEHRVIIGKGKEFLFPKIV